MLLFFALVRLLRCVIFAEVEAKMTGVENTGVCVLCWNANVAASSKNRRTKSLFGYPGASYWN